MAAMDLHVLDDQLPSGAHAQGLRLCDAGIHPPQHGQHKAGGLPTAIMRLGYQISEGRGEDHGQRLCLHP